ncbi:MAG: BREX-1 system phosphatase PglZ type A [Lysobacteraceae bacterium]|nr:MAG: BREX-1 system phosphatase PglZ type A [Xanthomonadaceae bacterium]
MNERRVVDSLRSLFATEQVVFWCDTDSQFTITLESLELGDGIEIVRLDQSPVLAVKRQLEQQPETRFLLYSTYPEPDATADWLLDVRLRAKSFRADLTTLLIEDLGLTSLTLAPYIRARSKFLGAETRRGRLKRLIAPGNGEAELDRKMMAVLLRSDESDALSITQKLLQGLWVEGQATIGAPPKAWTELQGYELEPAFWELMRRTFGYDNDEPTLADLLLRLLVTDFARAIGTEVPQPLRHLMLDNTQLAGNAAILAARWRGDLRGHAAYADLSAAVADTVGLRPLLADLTAEELLECMTFAEVERQIIHDLKTRVVRDGSAILGDIQSIIARRRDGHWANALISDASDEIRAMAACYDAVEAAAGFLALKERHVGGLSFADAESAVQAYRTELFRFDQLYRDFHFAAGKVEPMGWGVLHELRDVIEAGYSGWFIPALSSAWTSVLEGKDGLLYRWKVSGTLPQQRFFEDHVASALSAGAVKRVFVLISDAFRYEAGEELVRDINSKNRFTAQLDAMLGVLPSYTSLGMAALLPHQRIEYKTGANLDVLVDGQSTATLESRNAQLARYDGIAVRATDLLELGKNKGRELVGEHRVIYVYHDLIDMLGDKQGTEGKTFEAVADTLTELNRLISHIINNLNGSMVLVTADHGFLYQESALDEASKSALAEKPPGTLHAKKRYLIGRDLPGNDKVWQGNTALTTGTTPGEGSVDFWLPKGAMRFHFAGGARFVHGSAMPQEVIVPLITVRESENDKARTRPVEITLMGVSNKVVTNTQRFELIQTEAVSNRVLPRTVRVSIRDGETPISDEQVVTFDSTSSVLGERIKPLILTIRSGSYDRQKDYHLVARDAQSKVEVLRVPLKIDLAFSNDF